MFSEVVCRWRLNSFCATIPTIGSLLNIQWRCKSTTFINLILLDYKSLIWFPRWQIVIQLVRFSTNASKNRNPQTCWKKSDIKSLLELSINQPSVLNFSCFPPEIMFWHNLMFKKLLNPDFLNVSMCLYNVLFVHNSWRECPLDKRKISPEPSWRGLPSDESYFCDVIKVLAQMAKNCKGQI